MPKTIDTLIPDIHRLFGISHEVNEEALKLFSDTSADMYRRRFKDVRSGPEGLRLSAIGKPDRQLWYGARDTPREILQPSTHIKFMYGDMLEGMLLFLAKEAGHTVELSQEEVMVDGVKGHIDAVIDGVLIDVKTASVRGFEKFKLGTMIKQEGFGTILDDPFGYVMQLGAYNSAIKAPRLGWLAIEKEKGHLAMPLYEASKFAIQPEQVSARIKHCKIMIQEEIPERCYLPVKEGESGNLALGVGCSYCPFKKECWKDSNEGKGLRTFLYSNGPKYLVHVAREPKVLELTDAGREEAKEE